MPGITERIRPRARALARLLGLLMLGPCSAGCAAITRDVDAYYRQMAYNYQEALDQAKLEETSLQNQAKALAMTGEPSKARRVERRLKRIRSWEEHCAREKKRFEKAAEWMEAHFDLKEPLPGGRVLRPSGTAAASQPKEEESEDPSEAR